MAAPKKTPAAISPVRLPEPTRRGTLSIEACFAARRSTRVYSGGPLSLPEAGQLLWAGQGITGLGGLRAAPSAGTLYPLRTYVLAARIEGLPTGLYRYDPDEHRLEPVSTGDRRKRLARAAGGQQCIEDAAALILLAADGRRTCREFGPKGIRLIHLEAGHAGQSMCLQATALGLGVIGLGAFDEAAVKKALELPECEEPLYLIAAGRQNK